MSTQESLRAGVVGAGIMGERHARVFSQLEGIELVGIYDPDRNRADEVARAHGGRAFGSLNELLDSAEMISIASPTSTHSVVAGAGFDRGIHMLIEKPLAGTLAESRVILERASIAREQVVIVGHIERFNPTIVELRNVLRNRTVVSATMRRMSPFNSRCLDTDVIHDLMIHDIDLMLDLFGDRVASIDASGSAVVSDHIDQATARFSLDGNLDVTVIASRVAGGKTQSIEINTLDAHIMADLLNKTITITKLPCPYEEREAWLFQSGSAEAVTETRRIPATEPLRSELQHFVDCVSGATAPLVDVEAGFRAMLYASSVHDLVKRRARSAPSVTSLLPADD